MIFISVVFCNSSWTMTIPWKSSKREHNLKQGFYVPRPPEILPRRFDTTRPHKDKTRVIWPAMADAECWWHSRWEKTTTQPRPCPTAPPLLQTGSNCILLIYISLNLKPTTLHNSFLDSFSCKCCSQWPVCNQGQPASPRLPLSPLSTLSLSPIPQTLKECGSSKAAA